MRYGSIAASEKIKAKPGPRRLTRESRAGGRSSLGSTALALVEICALWAGATLIDSGPAAANPLNGQVVGGSAVISSPNANETDIVQSTDRAAIDWQSFNIAARQLTRFKQPSASSITLNRVRSSDPSVIAGQLTANGSIVLINPNGVTFAKGSQVDVHSLVATPSDVRTADFMAGKMKFLNRSKNPGARVVNRGRITVAREGLAALVAPEVANSGVIRAKLGRVVLGSAKDYTVDFYGDGLISFDVGPKVATVPAGARRQGVVSNFGHIEAPGGTVLLTADAAAGIIDNLVDSRGRLSAKTAGSKTGAVTVDAGAAGAAQVSGRINVSGLAAGQSGGNATVTGRHVTLARAAHIDARGSAGGGIVTIGGGPHGRDASVPDAQTTRVARGATVDANAVAAGNGGSVTVWSNRSTHFDGNIFASGGKTAGKGGAVETSGSSLHVGGKAHVDTLAPGGASGTWLLDPVNIDVETSGGTITPAEIVGALSVGAVDLAADNDITVGATIDATTNPLATNSLTLQAGRNICIGGPSCSALGPGVNIVMNPGTIMGTGSFSAVANDPAAATPAEPGNLANRGVGPGNFLMAPGDLIDTSEGAAATSINTAATLNISVDHGQLPPQFIPGIMQLGQLKAMGDPTSSSAIITAEGATALTTDGPTSSQGIISLQAGSGGITINSTITSAEESQFFGADLFSNGPITEGPSGAISVAALLATTLNDAGAPITLNGAANSVNSVTFSALNSSGAAAAGGSINFANGESYFVTGVATPGAFDKNFYKQEFGVNTATDAYLSAVSPTGDASITSHFQIAAANLSVRTQSDSSGDITLDNAGNAVSGHVTLSALNAAGTGPGPGSIYFYDNAGFTIAAQPNNGLNGQEFGVNTAAGARLDNSGSPTDSPLTISGRINTGGDIEVDSAGLLAVNAPITAGGDIVLDNTYDLPGPSLTIGAPLSAGGDTEVHSAGSLTVNGAIVAGDFISLDNVGLSEGAAAPPGAAITLNAPLTSGSYTSVASVGSLTVSGAITADGQIALDNSYAPGSALTINASLSSTGDADLYSNGPIAESVNGSIVAANIDAETYNDGGAPITLPSIANIIPGNVTLEALTSDALAPAAGAINFFDDAGFKIASQFVVGYSGAGLTVNMIPGVATTSGLGATLVSTGSISTAVGGGNVVAPLLNLQAGGPISLTDPYNAVGTVAMSTTGGGIDFLDSQAFAETGISAPGAATLTATGGGIDGANGMISAQKLTVAAAGPLALTDPANSVPGSVALTTMSGNIGFSDATGFSETGISTPGTIALTSTGGGIAGATGAISGQSLTAFATGPIALTDADNSLPAVALDTTVGGIGFVDSQAFAETGISAPGTATLTSTGGGIDGTGGAISARNLTVAAPGPIELTNSGNAVRGNVNLRVADFGTVAGKGAIDFFDRLGFTEIGIGTPNGVTLTSAGGGIDGATGAISGESLTASAAGPIELTDSVNSLPTVALNTTLGDIGFADSQAFIETGISTPGAATLTATGGGIHGAKGAISAQNLTVAAAGPLALSDPANSVPGNVALTTTAGDIGFTDLNGFTATNISGPGNISIETDSLALAGGITAGRDVLLDPPGSLSLAALGGNAAISAANGNGDVVISAAGPFIQTGVLNVRAGVIAIDTTGRGASLIAGQLPMLGSSPSSAAQLIKLFQPSGMAGSSLRVGNLRAPNSLALLIAGRGAISGTVNVGQLGVSGEFGSANLIGAIGGDSGPTAALRAAIVPEPHPFYLFNDCEIGGGSCVPTLFPVVVSAPNDVIVLPTLPPPLYPPPPVTVSLQNPPAGEIDVLREGPQVANPDAPVIDIFDEGRLCYKKLGSEECR